MTTLQDVPVEAIDDTEEVTHAHTMRIVDVTGDTKIHWDAEAQEEVDAAKEQFEKLIGKGWKAFSVKRRGKKAGDKGSEIKTFDPDAEMIIMTPPIAGG
jgi:hypothetical protein